MGSVKIGEDGFITGGKIRRKTTHTLPRKNGSIEAPFQISRGRLTHVIRGIVVHQTNTLTADKTFTGYTGLKANGAHFLIDIDGTIYQTASLFDQANHVGAIKARCLYEMTCPKVELEAGLKDWNERPWLNKGTERSHNNEKGKAFPIRFPKNEDSIGIECQGMAWIYNKNGEKAEDQNQNRKLLAGEYYDFDPLTIEQKESLKWLILFLSEKLSVPFTEIYRHPEIAFKERAEAISAKDLIESLRKEAARAQAEAETTQ